MKIFNEVPPYQQKGTYAALDVEMFGQTEGKLHRPTGQFACLSISLDGKNAYQIYEEKQVKEALRNLANSTWIYHNALYDLRQLRRYATIKPRYIHDIMLAEQSMTGGLYQFYSLKDLARRWLQEYMEKEVRDYFSETYHMTKQMREYAAKDAVKTWQIAMLQMETWSGEPAYNAYTMIDEPMIFPVLDMGGMLVDVDKWKETVTSFQQEADRIQKELGFNVKSVPQTKSALASVGLHVDGTGKDILKSLNHPLAQEIIKGRLYRDAVSKYGMTWLEENVESDGRVYSSWHITGAKTGRMSSSNPNQQNIPARELPIYRTFFIAADGHVMMVDDAHQQEPCILAYESQDDELLRAIRAGEDLHLTVARAIFGDFDKSDPEYSNKRAVGKTINLGTSYGLSEFGLANKLNITEQEAAHFLTQYFTRFRDVHQWIGQQRQFAARLGYVETASGRRAYVNPHDGHWQNNAINSPIQGGAVDMQKLWVRKFWEKCGKTGIPYSLNAVVHDETVKEPPKECIKETKKISDEAFHEAAETLFKGIPFSVETEVGTSWGAKQFSDLQIDWEEE